MRAIPPRLKTTPVTDEVIHRYIAENPSARDARTVVHKVLIALAMWPKGLTKQSIHTLVALASSGRTAKAFAEIEREGWWKANAGQYAITDQGRARLAELGGGTLATGRTLQALIAKSLESVTGRMFKVICAAYPASITKGEVLTQVQLASSGRTSRGFAQLKRRDLVTVKGAEVTATPELFWTATGSRVEGGVA